MRTPTSAACPRPRLSARDALCGIAALTLLLHLAFAPLAAAQGTLGSFADPRSGPEVEAWLRGEGLSVAAIERVWPIHERYLAEAARLRDGEIEAWLAAARGPGEAWAEGFAGEGEARQRLAEARSRLERKRRLATRLAEIEDRLWVEIAEALSLPPEALARLSSRGQRTRWNTPRLRMHLYGGGRSLFDTSAILERLRLDPERSAAVRERLAGHDEAMAPLLMAMAAAVEEEGILQFEAHSRARQAGERLQAEIGAEMEAAGAEERSPRLEEIHAAHHAEMMRIVNAPHRGVVQAALEVHRQRMAAVRRIWELLSPSQRMAIATMFGVPDGYEKLWPLLEAKQRRGELSREAAARVEEIREGYLDRQSTLAFELGALGESGWNYAVDESGSPQPPPGLDRIHELYGELWGGNPMRMLAELSQAVDLHPLLVDLMVESGATRQIAARMATAHLAHASGEEDPEAAEALQEAEQEMFDGALPLMMLPEIDEEILEAIGRDLGIGESQRAVAAELARDASAAQAAIRERFAQAARAARAAPGGMEAWPPPGLLESALREQLAVDEALLEQLAATAGADASRAKLWVDWRSADAAAFSSEVRRRRDLQGPHAVGGAPPWEGGYAGVDALRVLLEQAPAALRDAAIRLAVAEHLERMRPMQERHWESTRRSVLEMRAIERAMWSGAAVEDPESEEAAIAGHEARMALYGQHNAIGERLAEERARLGRAMRAELGVLAAALPPALGRSLHAGVRRAAWPDAVAAMPGVDAINLAESLAIADGEDDRVVAVAILAGDYAARSEALFAKLDELVLAGERIRQGAASKEEFDRQIFRRWRGTVGRLAFRHRELDFELFRRTRAISGERHAERFSWPEPSLGEPHGGEIFDTGVD